jgi:hypothetical protein
MPIGLWHVEGPSFSRQSTHRWRWEYNIKVRRCKKKGILWRIILKWILRKVYVRFCVAFNWPEHNVVNYCKQSNGPWVNIFWDVTPWSLVEMYHSYTGTCSLNFESKTCSVRTLPFCHFYLIMESVGCSRTWYLPTRRHISEEPVNSMSL